MNNRRQYLRWATGFLGAVAASPFAATAPQYEAAPWVWRERALIGFGTTLWIKVGGESADRLEAALDEAVREIRGIEQQMSLFNPDATSVAVMVARRSDAEPAPSTRRAAGIAMGELACDRSSSMGCAPEFDGHGRLIKRHRARLCRRPRARGTEIASHRACAD